MGKCLKVEKWPKYFSRPADLLFFFYLLGRCPKVEIATPTGKTINEHSLKNTKTTNTKQSKEQITRNTENAKFDENIINIQISERAQTGQKAKRGGAFN